MACACKVNQKIKEIQKTYGMNKNTIKTSIVDDMRIWFKQFCLFMLCFPFIPFMFLFIGFRTILTRKPFSMKKFLKLKR